MIPSSWESPRCPIPSPPHSYLPQPPDLAQLIHLVHEKIAKFKPHTNESEEMFEFRIKNWRDLLIKLQAVFRGTGALAWQE